MGFQIYEITGYRTGIARDGVNFLEPKDSFQNIEDGYVYRQELLSRRGFKMFSSGRLADGTRVMGIFENTLPTGVKESLVCTKEFLYEYNAGTNTYDQIPMAGAAPVGGFAIASDDSYVSGTTYPFPNGDNRFVFCSSGMTDIYFYDGTDVKVFTNLVDNTDYQAPAAGALTRATYVSWFGERLNFFVPVIAGVINNQMVLYSGIRTTSGNGDKFNVAGSGNLSADTYEYMTGMTIAGDYILLNFNRSSWTLEKTRDAFNPYFIRRIPSVLGTDAAFSASSWNNQTVSVGKTGILVSDGRTALRTDNKIPYFTADEIDQDQFNLTYGGYDRANAQFLFAYRDGGSSLASVTQDKVLVKNYEEDSWAIFNERFSVFGQTIVGPSLVWDDIYEVNDPSWLRMDETEEIWNKIGLEAETQKTLAGDNLGFVYELNQDFDDYFVNISAITAAASAVLTIDASAFQVGDIVSFANVGGMTEINGLTATVTAAAVTSITVNINSTNFTAYTSGGSVSKVISFYAETIPFNPWRGEGYTVYISHVEFLLNTNAGNLRVDVLMDEETTPFKSDVLLQPVGTLKAREWVTLIVNQEAYFFTFVMKQESPSSQVTITSIRIHCDKGDIQVP